MKNLPSTRKEALSLGSPTYFTGKPCKNGHTTLRKTSSTHCVTCDVIWSKIQSNKPLTLEKKKARCIVHARYRAKKSGIPFDITVDDITWPTHCPVLGLELDYVNSKRAQDNAATLDRIDNSKGYVKGNVYVISWRANALKTDATVDELQRVIEYIENPSNFVHTDGQPPAPMQFYALRHSAKRRGVSFDLTKDVIKVPEKCPVLGIQLVQGDTKRRNNPSVDRINNKLGYVKGNINVISSRANSLKADATKEELAKVVNYMANYQTVTFDKG